MLKTHLALFILLFLPLLAFAQTAAELDTLLEADAVTAGIAARFALGAVGLLSDSVSGADAVTAAYEAASSSGWVRSGQEAAISLQETAFLLMNVFRLKGGVMYTLFHNPRYAYREMIYLRLIPGRTYENMDVSGQRFLQILGRTLNYTGEREQMDAVLWNSGAIN